MTNPLHIALAQINPIVGDIAFNLRKIRQARDDAQAGALVVLPETAITGYPAEDLILKPAFVDAAMAAVQELVRESADTQTALIVTGPWRDDGKVYNALHVVAGGTITATRYKTSLPNYGVFDEKRIFSAGPLPAPVEYKGHRLGLMICEDMWTPPAAAALKEQGATLLIVPNASPYEKGKQDKRLSVARARVAETGLPLVYVNQNGGQDDLVFDGGSFILNETGAVVMQGERFAEALYDTAWERAGNGHWLCSAPESAPAAANATYQAVMLGLRDYVQKNGFPGVILGMSGGIDSALSSAIAVDALGADAVHAVMMPSIHTSRDSIDDAADCSQRLGIRHDSVSIKDMVRAFEHELGSHFTSKTPSATHENIQARCRGVTLMALSNASGRMVLSTGNKSELAVGYATLYGDMCGGYNVLKDIYKTDVYALARWRNAQVPPHGKGPAGIVIPDRILTKAPTAELRPGQTDQDSLPPYDVLDGILKGLVEGEKSLPALVADGYDEELVRRVWRMLDAAEYKRRQACPGPRVSRRAFGRERRYPLTNHFAKHIEKQG